MLRRESSSTYSILRFSPDKFRLIKIVGEYKSEKEAYKDMLSILEGSKTEIQVEQENWKSREIKVCYFATME